MTFRSFSRFVRWYRWTILFVLAGVGGFVLFVVELGYGNRSAAIIGVAMAIGSVFPGVATAVDASTRLQPVWKRYHRVKRREEELARARLRSQPLRGWTR